MLDDSPLNPNGPTAPDDPLQLPDINKQIQSDKQAEAKKAQDDKNRVVHQVDLNGATVNVLADGTLVLPNGQRITDGSIRGNHITLKNGDLLEFNQGDHEFHLLKDKGSANSGGGDLNLGHNYEDAGPAYTSRTVRGDGSLIPQSDNPAHEPRDDMSNSAADGSTYAQARASIVQASQAPQADSGGSTAPSGASDGASQATRLDQGAGGAATNAGAGGSPGHYSSNPSDPNASDKDAFIKAIAEQESGNYGALGAMIGNDRAYGKYQVMGANIPQWTQRALGHSLSPQEFLNDPQAQEATVAYILGGYYDQFGPQGAAAAWYAGPGNAQNVNDSRPQYGGPSIRDYVASVERRMFRIKGSLPAGSATGISVDQLFGNDPINQSGGGANGGLSTQTRDQTARLYDFAAASLDSVPELKAILDEAQAAEANGQAWDPQRFKAAIQGTEWFRTHNTAQQEYFRRQGLDPAQNVYLSAQHQDAVKTLASDYGVPLSNDQVGSFATSLTSGDLTPDELKAHLIQTASSLYPGLAKTLASGGITTKDIANTYRSVYEKTLETPAGDINDPTIQKALSYQDPKNPDQAMPLWQYTQMLKQDPRWLMTNGARNDAYAVATQIGKDWGVLPA